VSPTYIVAMVGAVTGVIALVGLIYTLGFKLGRIETQVDLLWKVTVEDALRRQRQAGNLDHSSGWRWNEQPTTTLDPLEEILKALADRVPRKRIAGLEAIADPDAVVRLVIQGVGYTLLQIEAEEADVAFSEYLVLCAVRIIEIARANSLDTPSEA